MLAGLRIDVLLENSKRAYLCDWEPKILMGIGKGTMKSANLLPFSPTCLAALVLVGYATTTSAQTTVIQEWNFTGGSLLSESGTNATFFGTVADIDGNDQYQVTRGDGTSGAVLLGTTINASMADLLTVSVTLSDFDFSNGNEQLFGVRFRSGTTTISDLRFDAQSVLSGAPADRIRLTGTAVAGVAVNATDSASPITYGLTLDFDNNTYTYWIGTPTSDASTWISRFANYTGAIDLSSVSVDGLQWNISNFGAGNYFNLDQIQVTTTTVPEPTSAALLGLGGLAVVMLRRRNTR